MRRQRERRQDNWECDYGALTNVSLEAMHCGLYSYLYVNARIDMTERGDLRNQTVSVTALGSVSGCVDLSLKSGILEYQDQVFKSIGVV